jgi:hypothetical protein
MGQRLLIARNEAFMKRVLRIAGTLLAVGAGGYFIAYAYKVLASHDLGFLLEPHVAMAAAALTVMYALLVPATALAWIGLLGGLGQPAGFLLGTGIIGKTQLLKYLPGNVAHHLGRFVVAKQHDLAGGPVALSMGYETLLTVLACAHVSALTFLWSPPEKLAAWPLAQYRAPMIIAITISVAVVMLAAPRLVQVLARLRNGSAESVAAAARATHPGWSTALGCYVIYVVNFILVGAGLWLVASSLSMEPIGVSGLALLTGAFASSWILGFLAPGAPAGLGVREGVLAAWLGSSLEPSVTVALIVILRVATTLGDLLTFTLGAVAMSRLGGGGGSHNPSSVR